MKLVHFWQSYHNNKSGVLFSETWCILDTLKLSMLLREIMKIIV